jgi:hypothetical protein
MTPEETLFYLHKRKRERDMAYAYSNTYRRDPRRQLSESAELQAAQLLVQQGWVVHRGTWHSRHDLTVGFYLRVEVKASTWCERTGGRGRYQVNYHNDADLVLWLCADSGTWFVIPVSVLGKRQNLAVTSKDANEYRGRWAKYRGRWDLVRKVWDELPPTPVQLTLPAWGTDP